MTHGWRQPLCIRSRVFVAVVRAQGKRDDGNDEVASIRASRSKGQRPGWWETVELPADEAEEKEEKKKKKKIETEFRSKNGQSVASPPCSPR